MLSQEETVSSKKGEGGEGMSIEYKFKLCSPKKDSENGAFWLEEKWKTQFFHWVFWTGIKIKRRPWKYI